MRRLTPLQAMVLVAAMTITITQWADYDIFWHLANGRLMVRDGQFPSPDPFSWSMAGHVFIAYSAQLDRLFYLVWQAGDAPALSLLSACLFALTLLPYVLLIDRLALRPIVEALFLFLIVVTIAPYRGARPHMVAFALFGLIVYLLEQPFSRRKAIVVGLALGAWANLHGTFYIGFALVATAAVTWLVTRAYRAAAAAGLALAIGAALSLLSPYGLQLWTYPLETASNPYLVFNDDWMSLRPLSDTGIAAGLLLLVAVAVGIRPAKDPRAIASIGLLLPAIHVARFVPFAMPLMAFVTLERLVVLWPTLKLQVGSPVYVLTNSSQGRLGAAVLLLGGTALLFTRLQGSLEAGGIQGRGALPRGAVDRLLACGEPAPIWNHYNWGGYVLWRGEGRYTVVIDGRAETLYSNQVFDQYFMVQRRETGWEAAVQASPARYALMPNDARPAFDSLPGWHRVFEDNTAILTARDGAAWNCSD